MTKNPTPETTPIMPDKPPEGTRILPAGTPLKKGDWIYMALSGGWRRFELDPTGHLTASASGIYARDEEPKESTL